MQLGKNKDWEIANLECQALATRACTCVRAPFLGGPLQQHSPGPDIGPTISESRTIRYLHKYCLRVIHKPPSGGFSGSAGVLLAAEGLCTH